MHLEDPAGAGQQVQLHERTADTWMSCMHLFCQAHILCSLFNLLCLVSYPHIKRLGRGLTGPRKLCYKKNYAVSHTDSKSMDTKALYSFLHLNLCMKNSIILVLEEVP